VIRNSPTELPDERTLQWAIESWNEQPQDIRSVYEDAAQRIAVALTGTSSSLVIQLPHQLWQANHLLSAPTQDLMLRVGGILYLLRRQSCRAALLRALVSLTTNPNSVTAAIGRLIGYLVGKLLFGQISSSGYSAAFDADNHLMVSEAIAEETVRHLCQDMERLKMIEQLFPGWTADDTYNETSSLLATRLISQGRALAEYYTRQIIGDLAGRWQKGEIIRGLTLYIPYLNERLYIMERHQVVVIPTGRIAFRPEFVLGACRVAQQEVRKNARLSQATRWQLISQLDSIIQAFEALKS
jgi:hypothetical protein